MSTKNPVWVLLATTLILVTCAGPDEEFDRDPVVEQVRAGPLLLRFYASATSTGGAATQFQFGEQLYLVTSVENDSGAEVLCQLHDINDDGFSSCGTSSPSKVVRKGSEVFYSDARSSLGLFCEPTPQPLPYDFPAEITIPAGWVGRHFVKVLPRIFHDELPKGVYTVEWHPNREFWVTRLCDYVSATTVVTFSVEIH